MFSRRCVSQVGRVVACRTASSSASEAGSGSGGGGGGVLPMLAVLAAAGAGASSYYVWNDSNEKMKQLQANLDEMQVTLSGKTNSAFVFVKPHAAHAPLVRDLLEETLKNNGIRITNSGEMNAGEIDRNMHIDTHYGAIASKAVKLKPYELVVPDKGQAEFLKLFGESWKSALDNGKVYNAKDGAAQLGLDAEGLNAKWSKLTPGKDLIKFGGGFYCGKVDGIYIMNGFYMSMRSAYTNPGEKIVWYTVQWPSDALTWQDFRSVVLGATDPSKAPKNSVRREIFDNYKALGLKSKPNTGDNGVHASASPFEAMVERANWLRVEIEQDDFGKALLKKVPKSTILEWGQDCQVKVEGETENGKTVSVFDALEDLDADTILKKVPHDPRWFTALLLTYSGVDGIGSVGLDHSITDSLFDKLNKKNKKVHGLRRFYATCPNGFQNMVVLSIFRFISRSNILIVLLLLAYVFTTALINILAMPIAFHKLVVPDARIVQGYTVEELRYFYTKIGPRGCDVYIRVEDFDFAIYMPTYMLLLGSLMVRSTRVFQCSDTTWGMLPVLAVTLDLMETYIQRQGCIRQLEEYEIRGASAAMQSKWMLIFISLLFIGSAFFTWVYQLCATPRKVKQS